MDNPFTALERETMKLIKQNGVVIEGIRTPAIKNGSLTVYNEEIEFEEGDTLVRPVPHGKTETYIIEDVEYRAEFHEIPAHYKLKLKNPAKKPKSEPLPQQVTYNLNGPNSRVNIHSTDHSRNTVGIEPDDLFRKIEEVLQQHVTDQKELEELKESVDMMRNSRGQPSFLQRYSDFMSLASDHMTVLTPFLPALAQLVAMIAIHPK